MEQLYLIKSEFPKVLCPLAKLETSRSLKIEEDFDPHNRGIKPKIRLRGNWLNRAGFLPGGRVEISFLAHGIMELRSTVNVKKEAL